MGIPIHGKGRRRRSYADYQPPRRHQGPRSDPFRIVFYILLIGAALWVYLNPDVVRNVFAAQFPKGSPVASTIGQPTATPTQSVDYAAQAKQSLDAGLLDDAIANYHKAGQAEPNNVEYPFQEARLLIYRAALEYGEQYDQTIQDAEDAANRAILADPSDARGHAILGKIKDWSDHPEAGLSELQRAVELDPDLAIAHSYMAEVLIDLDRWEQAQTTIDKAMELDPNSVDVRRDNGYILESLGDYASAQTQYEAALQLAPNLPNIKVALGRIYRVNGDFQSALDQFSDVESLYPNNALIAYEIGRTYETYVGDPNSAAEAYEHSVELDENFVSPWLRLGMLYYMQESYADSASAFEKVMELGVEDNVDVLYQLGLDYVNIGDCAKAIPMLTKARTLAENDDRILDAINNGFETCSEPTPTPRKTGGSNGSPAPSPTPAK